MKLSTMLYGAGVAMVVLTPPPFIFDDALLFGAAIFLDEMGK
jgi:hypothetical protein